MFPRAFLLGSHAICVILNLDRILTSFKGSVCVADKEAGTAAAPRFHFKDDHHAPLWFIPSMQVTHDNRRVAERYELSAPYTRVLVKADRPQVTANPGFSADRAAQQVFDGEMEGHAYDISVSGLRFELDDALEEGSPVEIEITLPGCQGTVKAHAKIVRVFDHDDDPGPRRMAAHFETFNGKQDEHLLHEHLNSGFCRQQLKY